ncbi:MAG: hypothetical protein KKH94_13320 [Candidatus Omnitrophica bacterium]|nr:hypothetical protein [Candidatus Omnitrophota bacterium]
MTENISYLPQQPIVPITGKGKIAGARNPQVSDGKDTVSFKNVLHGQIADQKKVKFSNHAQQRLRTRKIQFNSQQLDRLADAIDRAAFKGARDSLLLVDNIAAVVSVENRTIITVVEGNSLKDNVFTNIDSAVIA